MATATATATAATDVKATAAPATTAAPAAATATPATTAAVAPAAGETKETKTETKGETKDVSARMADEMASFPTVDLAKFLAAGDAAPETAAEDCALISKLLHDYGFLIVKDPRVSMKDNDTFIDTLEEYYGQPEEKKAADIRRELHYQVGITPTRTERARDHCERVASLAPGEKPITICPPELDNKLRFFWRIGDRPETTEFKQLNAEPVIPAGFPTWSTVMDTWGSLIIATVNTVAEMAAVGFKLPRKTFTDLLNKGPHLLAPTGSDFNRFGDLGTVLASYHYDLNFMTIHGRSRFPGLFIWTRDGRKLLVKVPENCLLLQAGKQFEWLTGGEVLAGFHEVVVAEQTVAAIARARAAGKSLWRVSSTLFSHVASDNVLRPLPPFDSEDAKAKYPATKAGTQVQNELNAIKLGKDEMGMGVVAAQ